MEGNEEKPLTREDVLRLIEENGGTAKGLDLSGRRFELTVDLSGLELSGVKLEGAWLRGANFSGSDLQGADFRQADLVWAKFHLGQGGTLGTVAGADFRGAILLLAHFEGCRFMATKLEGALIQGAFIAEADLGPADWGNFRIGEENNGHFDLAECQYRELKMWYHSHGYYDIAAKFYYREKEANRKRIKWDRGNWNHWLWARAVRLFFGYGERWRNILGWIALVVFGCAVVYDLLGGLNPLYSLYFSVVSFTALGYGSWVSTKPQGWVQALGAFESFVGVLMMALLLVLFVRKWTR